MDRLKRNNYLAIRQNLYNSNDKDKYKKIQLIDENFSIENGFEILLFQELPKRLRPWFSSENTVKTMVFAHVDVCRNFRNSET